MFMLKLFFALLLLNGCRGYVSEKPPFHVNPNMDTQQKGKSYRESQFFADGKIMQEPIAGTIAFGNLKEDSHFYQGKINGQVALSLPKNLVIHEAFIQRGKQVYNSKCSSCHSAIGDGSGLVGKRLMVKPTSFHSDYMYMQPPGHFFDVITNGIRTMQPYGFMLNEHDRWTVVAYIRVLQISQDLEGAWINGSAKQWKQQ